MEPSGYGNTSRPYFPRPVKGLDYYHCAQYIHKIAKAQYGTSVQALEWVEATMTRLSLGKVSAGGEAHVIPHLCWAIPTHSV